MKRPKDSYQIRRDKLSAAQPVMRKRLTKLTEALRQLCDDLREDGVLGKEFIVHPSKRTAFESAYSALRRAGIGVILR